MNTAVRLVGCMAICSLALDAGGCGDDSGSGNNQNGNTTAQGVCGDGVTDPGEQCDDGAGNSDVAPDACRSSCRRADCGDGVVDTGEQCDEGGANSDLIPHACRRSCALPACGDGVVDGPGEACDDGNTDGGDGCDAACQVEPGWECTGEAPSTCDCAPHRSGSGCAACVVYVDADQGGAPADGTSWQTAYADLQEGIDAAAQANTGTGCEVWVAEGTYWAFRNTPVDTFELRSGVGVYGGFAGDETSREQRDPETFPSVLDGAGDAIWVYHVISAVGTVDATLDGLVIQNARGLGEDDAYGRGGGVNVVGSVLTVQNCEIRENFARHGGGLAAEGSVLTIRDNYVHNNQGYTSGGGIWLHNCDARIEDTVLFDNWGMSDGGGLQAVYGSLVLERSEIWGNNATYRGGGMFVQYSAVAVRDSTLRENYTIRAPEQEVSAGGAAALVLLAPVLFERCTISDNSASQGGGIYASRAHLAFMHPSDVTQVTLRSSTVQGNYAEPTGQGTLMIGEGGGLFADAQVTVQVEDATLLDNQAVRGGGIAAHDAAVTLSSVQVRQNQAVWNSTITVEDNGSGGGAYTRGDAGDVHLDGSTFESNTAVSGGGLAVRDTTVSLTQSTLRLNVAYVGGGAATRGGKLTVSDTQFLTNAVDPSPLDALVGASTGGGLFVGEGGSAQVQGATFQDNGAVGGGGISVLGADASIAQTQLLSNSASPPEGGGDLYVGRGGGLLVGADGSATVEDSTFRENHALRGGGVAARGGQVEVSRTRILRNHTGATLTVAAAGGGISLELAGGVDAIATLRNCLILGNTAVGGGGNQGAGIYQAGGVSTLVHCTVVDNWSDGLGSGLYVLKPSGSGEGAATVRNSIFWNNEAGSGYNLDSQILLGTGASLDLTYSLVEHSAGAPSPFNGAGVLDGVPNLVDYANDDCHLQSPSPAIDHASPDQTYWLATDLDATSRVDGTTGAPTTDPAKADLGCYEFHP